MRYCEQCGAGFRAARKCPRDGTPTRADLFDPLIGRTIGDRYRIMDRVGAGGMGLVYRAAHSRIACTFAVKVLFGDLAYDEEMRARFLREAEVASCLSSRHIVRVIDFGQTEAELPYLVMEFLDGPSLADVISRGGALDAARATRITQAAARGLLHAHSRGVVHRDLKPENIALVSEDDELDIVKILDFGVARMRDKERLTSAGVVVGTPLYMAPEQFTGRDLDGRTDLYALGAVLYEMLSGTPPFDATTLVEISQLKLAGPPPPLRPALEAKGAPLGLDYILSRLLAPAPEDRFGSAREVIEALQNLGSGGSNSLRVEAPTIASGPPAAMAGSAGPLSFPPVSAAAPSAAAFSGVAPLQGGHVISAVERASIEAAIMRGAPLYNSGDHAGCYEVYRNTATMLCSAAQAGEVLRGRLGAALGQAQARPVATMAAWDLRGAFDDLLSAARVAVRSGRSVAIAAPQQEVLLKAIRIGAPAYNDGRTDVCARVYRDAAREILTVLRQANAVAPSEVLERALRESAGRAPNEAAWVLRHAFDRLLEGTE